MSKASQEFLIDECNNLLKIIDTDYMGNKIKIFIPTKCVISCSKIDMTDTYVNRNLLCKIAKADFMNDLVVND